jgi:hypothetical protein
MCINHVLSCLAGIHGSLSVSKTLEAPSYIFSNAPIHCFYSIANHLPIAESRSDIRRKLPRNIALGRELAVQIVRAETITALVRRPRAANLLAALPHQLREVVCWTGIVDIVDRHFRVPPVDAGGGLR